MTRYFPRQPNTFNQRVIFLGTIVALIFALCMFLSDEIWGQAATGHLTWDPVTQSTNGTPLTGVTYNVWRGTKPDGTDLVKINAAAVSPNSYADSTVTLTGVYYFAVSAVSGVQESGKSTLVRFCAADVVPATPQNLKATATVVLSLKAADQPDIFLAGILTLATPIRQEAPR